MEMLILPLSDGEKSAALVQLEQACMRAGTIREVIRYWTAKRGKLFVAPDQDLPFTCVSLTFEIDAKVVAVGNIPAESLRTGRDRFEKLNEDVDYFCDTPGYRINLEWFKSRNDRLGLKWNPGSHVLTGSEEVLPELISSYIQTNAGYAEISADEDGQIKTRLVYLDDDRMVGWYEEILVGIG